MPDEYDDIVAAAAPPKPRKVVRGMEKLTGVQPDLINHWNNLQTEFDKAGLSAAIKSGFRTAKQQNDIFKGPRGKWTKGNDGYNKISPHQEGRALDLTFSAPQRAKGAAIIADYAKRNGLHVPLDEPWHIAIPKQKVGQTDDEYADIVEAAMGQQADPYDDIVSAATPARTASRFGAARGPAKPYPSRGSSKERVRAQAQGAVDWAKQALAEESAKAPRLSVFENRARLPINPSKIEVRPSGFNFNAPDEKQVKADIRNQLVSEIAASTPEGRMPRAVGPELDAEVEARFKQLKQQEKASTIAAQEGPSMGARNNRLERAKAAIAPYTPGLQSLDTAAGIKLDAPRGAIRGLTLGLLGDQREITPEERILNPEAESRRNSAELVGEMATGFVPYVGAGKLLSKVPTLNRAGRAASATRTGATFGGVSTAREGIHSAKTGEDFNATNVLIDTAIGAAMGGIPGMSAGLKTRIAAAIGPQVAVDYARGTPIEQALLNVGTNFVFEVYGRKLGVSRKKFEEIRKQISNREVNVPERLETMQAQLDQRGFTLIPSGTKRPPLPNGMRTTRTPDGVFYYNPKVIDATTIRNTPTTELLGHVEPKSETTTEAVVARDPVTNTETQSSAVSPENVAKQAEVTQANFPEAKVEVGDANLAAEVIAERVAPQRYRHLEFGDVVKTEDQSGAAKGRVKVHEEGDPTKIHYPKAVDLQGRGNSRMIPIKESAAPEATPQQIIEAAGAKYIGAQQVNKAGDVGHMFNVGKDTMMVKGEVTPEKVQAKITEKAAQNEAAGKVAEPAVPTAREAELPRQQEIVEGVKAAIPAGEIWFHGSRAIGKGKKNSDWDILAVVDESTVPNGESYLRAVRAAQAEAQRLSTRDMEVNIELTRPNSDMAKVAREEGRRLDEPVAPTAAPREAAGETAAGDEQGRSVEDAYGELNDLFLAERKAGREDSPTAQRALSLLETMEIAFNSPRGRHEGVDIEFQDKWKRSAETAIRKLKSQTEPPSAAPTETAPAAPKVAETPRAATPELQPHADAAAELRSRLSNPELTSLARAAIERKIAREEHLARGGESRGSGGPDTQALIDDIIIYGDELYRKAKPKFDAWAKAIRAEFAEAKDKDLREIYAQLSGKRETSSVQNKASAELRADLGLLAMERPESKSWETAIANAEAKGLDKQAEAIADRVIKGGREDGLDYEESAAVLIRTRELENQWEDVYRKDPSDPKLTEIKDQLDKFTQAVDMGGTEPARTLNFRRAHVDKDFRLINMIKQAEAIKGRKVTTEETARYDSIVKERDAALKDRDKAMEQLQSKRLQNELDRASRQRSRADTKEKLDKEAAVIRNNIAAEFARLKAGFEKGLYKSAGGLGALDPEGVITRNLRRYVANRAKAHVGLKAEAVIDDAHALVKDFGVTRRQVAEAISGYGKPPTDRRSEAAKKLADIRAEITSLLKEEDVAAGSRSPRSEGPRLREGKGPKAGPELGPKQGPKLSDARKLPAQGPRLSEAPKLGPQNAIKRNAARLKELQRQEAEWERKFNERDFGTKAKPEPYPYNSDVRKADDRVKIAEAKFRREMERARPGHQFRNLSGVWKAWLLSGPPTQVMNIVGTGTWQAFREVSRLPAGIADAVWSATNANRMFGQSAKTPRSIQGPSPIAMMESIIEGGGKQGFREFMETMRHGAPKAVLERHQFQEIDFGINSRAIHAIELAHNAIFRFMSGSDRIFWNHAYRRNLIDRATMQAKNEGVSNVKERAKELVAEADGNTGNELHANASHDAFVDTFNNDNAFSTRIKRARAAVVNPKSLMGKKSAEQLNAAENFALDLILPFDRTPTNVITRILEASPLGYGKNAGQLAAAVIRGNMPIEHQRQMMQTFGNATAGTALMAMGWYLADPEKAIITVEGQDVYLNIPKLPRIPLRAASPAGNILASGARARAIHDDPKSSNWDYVKLGIREPINQPLLRATSSINDVGRDPKTTINKFAGKTASSLIPFSGAVRFAGQMRDPADKRYADNSFTEQFKRNIPVSRETLPSSRVRLLGSEVTKATKEAERLKITMRGATKQTDETDEDFAKREAIINPAIKAQIEAIVEHPDYDKKSDEDKTRWLKEAAQFATKQASDTIPEKPEKPEQTEFPMPTPKGVGFDSTYPADALAKFERMSPAQRTTNRASMEQKARVLLRDPRLSDEQKAEFKRRLDALGISASNRRSIRQQMQATP